MGIADDAFRGLSLDKERTYEFKITYSGKFKAYNANVRYTRDRFVFSLSKQWRGVSRDIQIGLLQSLFLKVFKEKRQTTEIDLYHAFLRKIHLAIPKTTKDGVLAESFQRVNEKYLHHLIEMPNLKWHDSVRKLGSYDYTTDTISISRKLIPLGQECIDYVMYHEMLHKKHKFTCNNNRTVYHSKEFREEERRFENWQEIEKQLQSGVRKAPSIISRLGFR